MSFKAYMTAKFALTGFVEKQAFFLSAGSPVANTDWTCFATVNATRA